MKYARIIVVAGVLAALAACQPKGAAPSAVSDTSTVLATVNGTPITENFLDAYVKALSQGKASASTITPEQRTQVTDQLIRAELVAQQAETDGVDKQSDTANRLANCYSPWRRCGTTRARVLIAVVLNTAGAS